MHLFIACFTTAGFELYTAVGFEAVTNCTLQPAAVEGAQELNEAMELQLGAS